MPGQRVCTGLMTEQSDENQTRQPVTSSRLEPAISSIQV